MSTATEIPVVLEPITELWSGWKQWADRLPLYASRLITAAVVVAAGVLVLWIGRRIIRKAEKRAKDGKQEKASAHTRTLHSLFLSIFNYTMYFVIALTGLSAMGVDVSSLLTVAGVGGVAIAFGSQTLVKDVISGLFLWIEGRLKVGDVVTVGGQTGTVESIALRTTTLRGTNGSIYAIPNGDIRTVINMSWDYRCAQVDLTVSHGQPLSTVLALLQDEMDQLGKKLSLQPESPQVLGVIGSDFRAATVRIQCKCKVEEVWALEREIRLAALERLQKEGYKP